MKCPHCGLFNPDSAEQCDCGYRFATKTMGKPIPGAQAQDPGGLASLESRFGGQLLDSLVAIAILLIGALPAVISQHLGGITFLVGVVAAVFYTLFSDGFAGGQSYGKRVVGTKVIDATKQTPCSYGQSFGRNFFLALLGPIDWLFIFGARRQRLGDKAANTLVVRQNV